MADFLDEKRSEIGARLKELKPIVEEYSRLEAAAAALDGADGAPMSPRRTVAHRAPAASKRRHGAATHNGRGRPKGTGKRAAEALALVTGSPGITIPQLAEKMGIKQNYLYRVMPGLAQDGLVTKDGQGWHPKAAA
ncbi:MAG TPA: hypothetical protein VHZ31_03870 [Solirubrobacteraceae bacterium]|nr:hypothetical protein [Solirubrobacteraceae bacterium]